MSDDKLIWSVVRQTFLLRDTRTKAINELTGVDPYTINKVLHTAEILAHVDHKAKHDAITYVRRVLKWGPPGEAVPEKLNVDVDITLKEELESKPNGTR